MREERNPVGTMTVFTMLKWRRKNSGRKPGTVLSSHKAGNRSITVHIIYFILIYIFKISHSKIKYHL